MCFSLFWQNPQGGNHERTVTFWLGTPADSTMFYSLYLFQVAFFDFKMGYACAMAWILFLLILAATLLIFRTSARHVYYAGGDRG